MKVRTAAVWVGLGASAYGLQAGFGRDSALVERWYSRGLFVGFRWAWDSTMGTSPLPWVYLVAAALAALIFLRIVRLARRGPKRPRTALPKRAGRLLLGATGWAGALVFVFYLVWGFNYGRVGIQKQIGLDVAPLRKADLAAEAAWAAAAAAEARAAIPGASSAVLSPSALPAGLEDALRASLSSILREAGYPTPGRVRVRTFVPGGWMMRFSSTGVYVPFFGESYAAGNLLPFERPFTWAHEMAHGFGIAYEGEANFLAFLACRASADPMTRYSGLAGYWEYAAGELARADREAFRAQWASLPEGMRADIVAAQRNAARYSGLVEKVSRTVYGRYLKAQGVDDGLLNYSRFVGLVAAWRRKSG